MSFSRTHSHTRKLKMGCCGKWKERLELSYLLLLWLLLSIIVGIVLVFVLLRRLRAWTSPTISLCFVPVVLKKKTIICTAIKWSNFHISFAIWQWVVQGAVDVDIGANPSAEGGGEDEGVDDQAVKVVDIVDTFRLQVRKLTAFRSYYLTNLLT